MDLSGVLFIICVPSSEHEKRKFNDFFTTENVQVKRMPNVVKEVVKPSMEKRLEKCLLDLNIENAIWSSDKKKNYFQVSFCVAGGEPCEQVLQILGEFKIGQEQNSSVCLIPCSLPYETNIPKSAQNKKHPERNCLSEQAGFGIKEGTAWERFVHSVRARLTVAEVIAGFKANAYLTFDFIALLIIAAIVAALGLVENSMVILTASMLISPLMGPVMAGTFGYMVKDRKLQTLGFTNEFIGLLLCVVIGYLFGIFVGLVNIQWSNELWPTQEMKYKGEIESLWIGVFIALPSGAAVAIAVLGDNTVSFIGVAISLSLMPPAVNAGLLWALATLTYILGPNVENPFTNLSTKDPVLELTRLGAISLSLTFVNIVCIFVSSIVVFKIKEVTPVRSNDYSRQFWKETFKMARDYKHISNEDLSLERRLVEEIESQATISDDLRNLNLLKHHPNFRSLNQYTWSPCSSNFYSRPTMQELAALLHPVPQVTCRIPHNYRRNTQPSLSYIWRAVNSQTYNLTNDTASCQLSAIFERQKTMNQQANTGRRFIVTPAADP